MDSIELATQLWMPILRVGRILISLLLLLLSTDTNNSVNSFAPPYWVGLLHSTYWTIFCCPPLDYCVPQLKLTQPDLTTTAQHQHQHYHHGYFTAQEQTPGQPTQPTTRSLISSHTQFKSRLLQLHCFLYTYARPEPFLQLNATGTTYNYINLETFIENNLYYRDACACYSSMLWLIHLFIFIIIYQIARKQLSQNDKAKLRDKRFFCWSSPYTSFLPAFRCFDSPLLHVPYTPSKLSASAADGQLIVLSTTAAAASVIN